MAGGRNSQRTPRGGAQAHAQAQSQAQGSSSSSSAPPLPPPLPPPPAPTLDDLVNAPVRIYPLDRSPPRANANAPPTTPSAALFQCLQGIAAPAVVVGVLASDATSSSGVYAFINRLIGRAAFQASDVEDSAFGPKASLKTSIQVYYDPTQSILFLLGVSKPDAAFLASLDLRNEELDVADALESFQNDKRKLELLMHTCSHLLFQFHERGQFTTSMLKELRAVAAEKQSLLALLSSAPSGKTPKRSSEKGNVVANVLAPGRCVPLTMFVVPARDDVLAATLKQLPSASAIKARSATVAYCKAREAMLCNLFRSLRGGIVGTVRTRDAVTPGNLGKERRLFHVDPVHCVAVVSQTSATDAGSVDGRFDALLNALTMDELMNMDTTSPLDLDALLEPLEDDDVGYPHAIQHMHRGMELIQQHASSGPTSKDTSGVKMELLTVAHWLKAFQSLLKTLYRAEMKKKQDRYAEAARYELEHLDVRS